MQISAYKLDEQAMLVCEPVSQEIHYTLVERDGELFADLNDDDLESLYEALPHGASRDERGDIECYLCSIAEADRTRND